MIKNSRKNSQKKLEKDFIPHLLEYPARLRQGQQNQPLGQNLMSRPKGAGFTDKQFENETESNQSDKTAKIEQIINPLWLSVSEAAKLGGVKTKTIRRAIKYNHVKYKILGNRYLIDFTSAINYLHTKTKLRNKFYQFGLGQYVDKWK